MARRALGKSNRVDERTLRVNEEADDTYGQEAWKAWGWTIRTKETTRSYAVSLILPLALTKQRSLTKLSSLKWKTCAWLTWSKFWKLKRRTLKKQLLKAGTMKVMESRKKEEATNFTKDWEL